VEEAVPIAPVVAQQPVAPESTRVPLPGKSGMLMVVLGASIVLITVIISISVLQKSVLAHEKNRKVFIDSMYYIFIR
jgi:hypothetical protein